MIKYEISDFMTLYEFEKYVNVNIIPSLTTQEKEDKESQKKYFLLIIKNDKFDELIPCNIYTYKDLQLRPIENRTSDYVELYNINGMKNTMKYKKDEKIEYYVALDEKVIIEH